jgi:transcriptional regulator with XRE-family HTH domain
VKNSFYGEIMEKKFAKFAKNLLSIRESRGLSQEELSRRIGVNRGQIWKYEKGDVKPQPATLQKLAECLHVEIPLLLGEEPAVHYESAPKESFKVPLYGEIPAGNLNWLEGSVHPIDWVHSDERDHRNSAFALRVVGTSMQPRYMPRDILVLKPLHIKMGIKGPEQHTPRATFDSLDGRCVAVLLNGETTVKKLEVEPTKGQDYLLHLRPVSEGHQIRTIRKDDEVEFQGVVYKLIREED